MPFLNPKKFCRWSSNGVEIFLVGILAARLVEGMKPGWSKLASKRSPLALPCPLSFVDVPERAYVEGMLGVYERRQVDLLRDVFVWAYERSCGRYLVIKDDVAAPDPVRLRNHEALRAIVGDIVRSLQRPTREAVTGLAEPLVQEGDRARFIEMALDELALLHEGNVARYRLRLSEYLAWVPVRAARAP